MCLALLSTLLVIQCIACLLTRHHTLRPAISTLSELHDTPNSHYSLLRNGADTVPHHALRAASRTLWAARNYSLLRIGDDTVAPTGVAHTLTFAPADVVCMSIALPGSSVPPAAGHAVSVGCVG